MSVAVGQTPETRNVRGVALYMALVARFPLRPLRSERVSTAPPRLRTSWRSVEISRDGSTIISMSFPT